MGFNLDGHITFIYLPPKCPDGMQVVHATFSRLERLTRSPEKLRLHWRGRFAGAEPLHLRPGWSALFIHVQDILYRDVDPLLAVGGQLIAAKAAPSLCGVLPTQAFGLLLYCYAMSASPDFDMVATLTSFAGYLPCLLFAVINSAGLQLGAQVAFRLRDDTTGVGWRALICGQTVSLIICTVQTMCITLITTPFVFLQPDFRLPDDGLDAMARKDVKICLCSVITVPPLLIIASSMRR